MKRRLKPGADIILRMIRRLAIVAAVIGVIVFVVFAFGKDVSFVKLTCGLIGALITIFSINVIEAANECLTGYIYGGDDDE